MGHIPIEEMCEHDYNDAVIMVKFTPTGEGSCPVRAVQRRKRQVSVHTGAAADGGQGDTTCVLS